MVSSIEKHLEREKIELDLILGKSIRDVAKKYGLSKSSCHRYLQQIPPHVRAANLGELLAPGVDLDKLRTEESRGLIAILASQRAKLHLVQDSALANGDHGLALKAANAIHRNAELIATYLGELVTHTKQTSVSIVLSPAYMKLRSVVTRVLAKYPAALQEFTDEMLAYESAELGISQPAPALIEHAP